MEVKQEKIDFHRGEREASKVAFTSSQALHLVLGLFLPRSRGGELVVCGGRW